MSKAIDALVKNDFSFSQAKIIIAKLKEQWGQIKSWSVPQLQKLGKLLKDLNVEDLKFLSKEQFQVQVFFFEVSSPRISIRQQSLNLL